MKKRAFGKIKYGFLSVIVLVGVLNLSLGHLAMASEQRSINKLSSKDRQGVCVLKNDLPVSSMLPCCLGSDHKMIDNINVNQKDETRMPVMGGSYGKADFSHSDEQKNTCEINFSPPERQALAATIMRE